MRKFWVGASKAATSNEVDNDFQGRYHVRQPNLYYKVEMEMFRTRYKYLAKTLCLSREAGEHYFGEGGS